MVRNLDDDVLRRLKAAANDTRQSLQAEIDDVLRRASIFIDDRFARRLADHRQLAPHVRSLRDFGLT